MASFNASEEVRRNNTVPELSTEEMDTAEADSTPQMLPLLSPEEFASKSGDLQQTNSEEEDARILRENARLQDDGILDSSSSLLEMKKEADAAKKKQKQLNEKIREMERQQKALDKEKRDKDKLKNPPGN